MARALILAEGTNSIHPISAEMYLQVSVEILGDDLEILDLMLVSKMGIYKQ